MRINLGTKVVTADGKDVGKIDRLIVDPRTDRMQEFVVRKGFFIEHDIVIPIGAVDERASDDEAIHLLLTEDKVKELPEFVETTYVAAADGMYPGLAGDPMMGGVLWPAPIYEPADAPVAASGSTVVAPGMLEDRLRESRPGSVFLSTGTDVKTRDGEKIGTVDELVVDPKRGKVTEVIVKKGLIHHKEIRIPTQFIDEIDDDAVYVALDKERLERFTVEQ